MCILHLALKRRIGITYGIDHSTNGRTDGRPNKAILHVLWPIRTLAILSESLSEMHETEIAYYLAEFASKIAARNTKRPLSPLIQLGSKKCGITDGRKWT